MLKYLKQINASTTSKQYPTDYFDVNINIMKIATIWYPRQHLKTSRLYLTFSIFTFIYCCVFCTTSEFISLLSTKKDLNAFIMNFGIALTHGICNIKVINWYIRRKEILCLMEILKSETFHYEASGKFEPGFIMQKAKQTNITLSTIFFWLGTMVPVSGYIIGFLNFFLNRKSFYPNDQFTFVCTSLPFYSWIPFDYSTELSCMYAMLFQSFPMIYLTLMIVAVDTTFMSLINYITAHLIVLQGAFSSIRTRAMKKCNKYEMLLHDDEDLDNKMMEEIKKCIKHLQTIQRMCKFMENVYSIQTLCQVLVSLFVLCTCLYLISTVSITSKVFLVEIIYVFAIEYQLTLYCWFGNELTLASKGINQALYNGDWLSASSRFKKSMIITMIRMERPLRLTVGKFTPLTVETLQTILRGSYSLYAVLKNRE